MTLVNKLGNSGYNSTACCQHAKTRAKELCRADSWVRCVNNAPTVKRFAHIEDLLSRRALGSNKFMYVDSATPLKALRFPLNA